MRFSEITPTSVRVVDAVVKDELMRAVLHPDEPPQPTRIAEKAEEGTF